MTLTELRFGVLGRAKHLETKSWYLSIDFRPNTDATLLRSLPSRVPYVATADARRLANANTPTGVIYLPGICCIFWSVYSYADEGLNEPCQ